MILKIEVKNEGKVDYASLKRQDGARDVTLTLKKLNGSEVEVFIHEDIGKTPSEGGWLPYPNPADRTPLKILKDGPYWFPPTNNFIQLRTSATKATLDMLTVGMNLRGKTFIFDTSFDVSSFLSAITTPVELNALNFGFLGTNNAIPPYGDKLGLSASTVNQGQTIDQLALAFGSVNPMGGFPTDDMILCDKNGWRGTSFTVPDDKDYIITSGAITDNALAKAITVDIEMEDIESSIIATLS